MPWTFVRPTDSSVLEGRPLLDLGTGDGQTLGALIVNDGLIVGLDRSLEALRAARSIPIRVNAEALQLPFRDRTFRTVLAGDLFHHLDDDLLRELLTDVMRILLPDGRLVSWWYEVSARSGPDVPRFPRLYEQVERVSIDVGFAEAEMLGLGHSLEPSPRTVGLLARKGT